MTRTFPAFGKAPRHLHCVLASGLLLGSSIGASAQVSLTSAVDLALRNSPRVKMAQADVDRAQAGITQAKAVYIPNLVGQSSGLGYSYGFPLGPPSLFSFSSGSLVFSFSQRDYIRAAEAGLAASTLALKDIRQAVAEDTVNTYLALALDQQQHAALTQEAGFAARLEAITKDRLDAGTDPAMDYTRARRTGVQIRLQLLQLDDDIATQSDHLARLIGRPGTPVETVATSVPEIKIDSTIPATAIPDTPGVQAAFATAHQKLEQAFGDNRYTWRPQVTFGAEYSKLSFYNNNYPLYYPGVTGTPPGTLANQAAGFALNVTLPLYDRSHQAKARESMADAVHAQHDAENIRDLALEGRLKLHHSIAELAARAELASLDKDIAQQELDTILVQLQSTPSGAGPIITPKDEQNARIRERQLYIDVLDAQYKLRQAQISLLRQTGQLENWLKEAVQASLSSTP